MISNESQILLLITRYDNQGERPYQRVSFVALFYQQAPGFKGRAQS